MLFSDSFFALRCGITRQDLESYLADALSQGGDYADLYFEYLATSSISLDESIVKSAAQGVSLGVGVRVIAGERTGYAYTDDLSPEKIRKAAKVAACIAAGPSKVDKIRLDEGRRHNLYPVLTAPTETAFAERVEFVKRADQAARAYDPRIFQVQAMYADNLRQVMVATSEGVLSLDRQPLARLSVSALAREEGGQPQRGHAGGGGRVELDFFLHEKTPEHFALEAAREAIAMLDAVEAPAGEMTVVLGPGWPGILLHEAVGHGLEADFNRKQTSNYSGQIGKQVASPLCTVVDDGTIINSRGAINVDDEGFAGQKNVLIENGILVGYMHDRLSAKHYGITPTGNGRRESFRAMPLPRMTNTSLMGGQDDPDSIIKSVKRGIYAKRFSGGQVNISNGDFVFSLSESYLIEDGKLTAPLKGVNLIGNGPDVLRRVDMLGSDYQLSDGIWTCGKDGQSVPVNVGTPTVRIASITVGGTQA
jgi:TldD protein